MVDELRQHPGDLGPGSRLGKYVLEQQIGRGGMATVFRARDEQLGRPVALKVLAPALADDEDYRRRFIRESRAAAAVDDPHILPVFDAGEADGVLFIAMRYVPGGDVRSLIARNGPLDADRVAAILSAVASALDAANAAGLVHRDVKPGNMLLDVRPGLPDHVYLSDFGLTKSATGSTSLTRTGLFLGTVDYVAPEQIEGRVLDGRADQYSLACAGFEMLTGRPPFPREQPMSTLTAHLSQQPPPVSAERAGLPPALDRVFARALAKSPGDRYASCRDFSDAVRSALAVVRDDAAQPVRYPQTERGRVLPPARERTAALAAGPGDSSGGGRRPPRRWLFVLAAAVVAAGVITGFTLLRHGGGTPAASGNSGSATVSTSPSASWQTYHDPSGFSISLPQGWTVASSATDEVQFTGAPPGFVLVVAWTHTPAPDALADWRQQAADKAAADATYRQILVQRVTYRGYNAADWEFTNQFNGELTRVIDRTFIVRPGQLAYAIELYGPAASWPGVYAAMWQPLLTSFEPAS